MSKHLDQARTALLNTLQARVRQRHRIAVWQRMAFEAEGARLRRAAFDGVIDSSRDAVDCFERFGESGDITKLLAGFQYLTATVLYAAALAPRREEE